MSEETQKNLGSRLIVYFEDKPARRRIVMTVDDPGEARLKELNGMGNGIFLTANSFFSTREQRDELAKSRGRKYVSKRNTEFLTRLNEVFADLDVCKDTEGMKPEDREQRKIALKDALYQYCPPSSCIITKNGLQPRWWINEDQINKATQEKYVNVINGVIEWSKRNGAKGDPVKDVTRILRKPGYYHQKSDPYLVTEENGSGKTYTLDELKKYFWHEPGQRSKDFILKDTNPPNDNSAIKQIAALDIRQVVTDVWAEKGSVASFDKDGHLVVDGVVTATFKGKLGEGNFIATSSSDYPAKGNAVTYVAATLNISTKEAFKWLCKKYIIAEQKSDRSSLKTNFTKEAVHALAIHLIEKYHIKTIKGKNREMYIYKDGVYILGEDVVRKDIRELLEGLCNAHYSREIVEAIKDLTATDRNVFEVDESLINCGNGIYDLKSGKLLPHDPQYAFLTKIPVAYDIGADCPGIKKYLGDVLDKEQILILQEWFGYALYRQYFIKKALICVGEGDTGKSTLINIFFSFVGPANVSGVSLQRMGADKFAVAGLYNKLINLFDDLSFSDIQDNGAFKIATGGSIITGEKKFGDSFQFKNFAKLTFTCNRIPDMKDTNDEAYFNRWIVIPFSRTIEVEQQDRRLVQKITTPEELSGLLNFALAGLYRLLERQDFSYDKEAGDIKTEMLRSASPIMRFADDVLKESTGKWISKEEMYQAFQKYAHKNNAPVVSMKAFCSRLPMCATYLIDYKPLKPEIKRQISAWRNVEFKEVDVAETSEENLKKPEAQDLFAAEISGVF